MPLAGTTEDGRIQLVHGSKTILAPENARWALKGDLRANATFVRWAPNYRISRRAEPEYLADPGRPFEASIAANYVPRSNAIRAQSGDGLRYYWPGTSGKHEVLVAAWIVNGEISQVVAQGLDPAKGRAVAKFSLSKEDAAGQPVLLMWAGGRFFAPLRQFADTIDSAALMAAMTDDWDALKSLVDAQPKLGSKLATDGGSLLHLVAQAGASRVLAGLVSADPKARLKTKELNLTPIDLAAGNGREGVVEFLLQNGFSGDVADKESRTPILRAALGGHDGVVALLLKARCESGCRIIRKAASAERSRRSWLHRCCPSSGPGGEDAIER